MNGGFRLGRLTLAGSGKPDAEVGFTAGLNVIAGPSDTGKTYIFQCIDYALGGSEPPKAIPEAHGYESVRLSLQTSDAESYTLLRSLRGGDVRVVSPGDETRVLKPRHAPGKSDTISAFLLELAGLTTRTVRTNASGSTRELSFRDIARLTLVDEETVITTRSPAFSGQFTSETVESRVLRLLLTGEDDGSIIAAEDPKVVRGRRSGQAELLERLIARTRATRGQEIPHTIDAAEETLQRARAAADQATAALAEHQEAATEVEAQRRAAWADLRTTQSRIDVLQELQSRFGLLSEQYESDLRRLTAIAEASMRLDQMSAERCPVCGALAEHHQHTHVEKQSSPSDIRTSCIAEAAKITVLVEDLDSTQASNAKELDELAATSDGWASELAQFDDQLDNALRPKVAETVQTFQRMQSELRGAEQALDLLHRERELQELLDDAQAPSAAKQEKLPSPSVTTAEASGFANEAESLLRAWHFPDLERVTFSEAEQDLVITGRGRASHGKGVRAITHAAFVLALLRYCLDSGLPSPGLVAIDSPLVVYREPDPEDGTFPPAVKDFFFRSIASSFGDAQVLVIENDAPPAFLGEEANVINFTKTGVGRYGFIPQPES